MCTRFYVEPDNEEIREIIAEVQRSQLSDKFIKAGSAILTSGEIRPRCAGNRSGEERTKSRVPDEMGLFHSGKIAAGKCQIRDRRTETHIQGSLGKAQVYYSCVLVL